MPRTERTGPDTPATLGGPGWQPRVASHAEEVTGGLLWRPYRVSSEVEPLRAVLLALPGPEFDPPGVPDAWLMLAWPDRARLEAQIRDLAALYTTRGVAVHLWRPAEDPPPNFIFQRDLFAMTPEGALLGRPAARQRAGEERFVAEALASIGVPLVRSMRGTATFEGADLLWLRPDRVLLGVGRRTDEGARAQIAQALSPMGVTVIPVDLPDRVQHLLGVVDFLDVDLAAVHGGRATPALLDLLDAHGVRPLLLPPDRELVEGRGMNVVALGPREVVMPAGCPGIRRRFEAEGVRVHEVDLSEALKAAGGPGCLTGVLWRG